MHRIAIVFLALALVTHCSISDASESSAESTDRVDSLFSKYSRGLSPGLAVAIVREGKVLLAKGYGLASLEHRIPITPATVFDVASVSKQFTGLAVAMLIEQGKIRVSDDIRKYVPELHEMERPITIDHLLHHTSGLRDWPSTLAIAGWRFDDVISFDQILTMAYHQRTLNFTPGAEYSYCNTEYNLLAQMIARVTGKSFRVWMDENIFRPLRMTSSHFEDDHTEVIPNRAFGYSRSPNGTYHTATDNLTALGSSSLFASADDLAKWVMNFDIGTIGGRSALALMRTRGVLNNGTSIPYAFGVEHGEYRGLPTVNHGGGWASFSTYVVHFPGQHFGVIVLANSDSIDAARAAYDIADIYLGKELGPRPPAAPSLTPTHPVDVEPAILDGWAGLYRLGPDWFVRIRRDGNELKTRATRETEFPMTPRSANEFWVEGYRSIMAFERSPGGGDVILIYHGKRYPKLQESPALTHPELEAFVGEYFSDELRTSYRIDVLETSLVMQHPRYGTVRLTQFWRDEFSGNLPFMNPQFERDAAGTVTGFIVTAGNRSRDNRFVRRR